MLAPLFTPPAFVTTTTIPGVQYTLCETDSLAVKMTPQKGRGVFAKQSFEPGQLIESVPVILLRREEEPSKDQTLYSYTFAWGAHNERSALALGYGSMYNHSSDANAIYEKRESSMCIDFIAQKAIAPGEEITIDYLQGCTSDELLWFYPADE